MHRFEEAHRPSPYDIVEKADELFSAGGRLIEAWRRDDAERYTAAGAHRTKAAALAMSELAA